MLVDASYLPWVRPAHRVHVALSVGMTFTGVVLALCGIMGTRTGVPVASQVADRTGDTVVVGDGMMPVVVPSPMPSMVARPPHGASAVPVPAHGHGAEHSPTHSPAHGPAHSPTHGPAHSPSHSPTHLPSHGAKAHRKPRPHPRPAPTQPTQPAPAAPPSADRVSEH